MHVKKPRMHAEEGISLLPTELSFSNSNQASILSPVTTELSLPPLPEEDFHELLSSCEEENLSLLPIPPKMHKNKAGSENKEEKLKCIIQKKRAEYNSYPSQDAALIKAKEEVATIPEKFIKTCNYELTYEKILFYLCAIGFNDEECKRFFCLQRAEKPKYYQQRRVHRTFKAVLSVIENLEHKQIPIPKKLVALIGTCRSKADERVQVFEKYALELYQQNVVDDAVKFAMKPEIKPSCLGEMLKQLATKKVVKKLMVGRPTVRSSTRTMLESTSLLKTEAFLLPPEVPRVISNVIPLVLPTPAFFLAYPCQTAFFLQPTLITNTPVQLVRPTQYPKSR